MMAWQPPAAIRTMPRFKLTIEYAGTRYSGWQIQTNARTIQGELVKAVRAATGRDSFEVYGAGRTDAGVHALAQVAHLDVGTSLPPATLRPASNEALPRRHPRPPRRSRVASLPRPPRRDGPRLPVPDRAAPHRLRQAVRLVGARSARRRRGCASGAAAFAGMQRLRLVHRRRSRGEVDDGGHRLGRPSRTRARSCWCASSARTSCGRWCGGWSACSSASAPARSIAARDRRAR